MNIEQLKELAENRIAYMTAQKENAEQIGDFEAIARFDADIAETTNTLTLLNSL
jgi:hypothetical protein